MRARPLARPLDGSRLGRGETSRLAARGAHASRQSDDGLSDGAEMALVVLVVTAVTALVALVVTAMVVGIAKELGASGLGLSLSRA